MFLFGLAHLSASTCRGDRNAHNDFLVGIILVSLGFPGLLYCWAYKRYCVTDKIMVWVSAMTILLSTSRSWPVLTTPSSSDQSPSLILPLRSLRTASSV